MHVVLSVGEASGDLLAAGLMQALSARVPGVRFSGIAGPKMEALGCEAHMSMERLSVMGLVEVAGRYVEIIPKRRELAARFITERPDVFIGVDAPDFNLSLEKRLRRAGIPTVHYVSPSVWAWREYRVRKIRRAVDRLLLVFPFEASFYAHHGVPATFVGHHLADTIQGEIDRTCARQALGVDKTGPIVGLLPGSRMSEVSRLGPLLFSAAKWLARRIDSVAFMVPTVNDVIQQALQRMKQASSLKSPVHFVRDRSHQAMAACNVLIMASGTATLEAMLLRRPMVITYRTHPVTWSIGRHMLKLPYVGLPNILAGEMLVPELLQQRATASALGASALAFLASPERCAQLNARFERIHQTLKCDASQRAADAVLALISAKRGGRAHTH